MYHYLNNCCGPAVKTARFKSSIQSCHHQLQYRTPRSVLHSWACVCSGGALICSAFEDDCFGRDVQVKTR
jgi:hypothetical protein